MEHKIGEIVTLPDGRKAKVVENGRRLECSECAMWLLIGCMKLRCVDLNRTDGKNIIYKEVKED